MDRGATRLTDLTAGAIELNNWNKMNARFVKAGFNPNTMLNEILGDILLQMGVPRDEFYRVADHPTGMLGYHSTAVKKLRELLRAKDPNNANLAGQISLYEFAANLSEFYNWCILKVDQLITWANIDKLKAHVKKNLEYFKRLRKA